SSPDTTAKTPRTPRLGSGSVPLAFLASWRFSFSRVAELLAELLFAIDLAAAARGRRELGVGLGQRAVHARIEGVGGQRVAQLGHRLGVLALGQQRLAREQVRPGQVGGGPLPRRQR